MGLLGLRDDLEPEVARSGLSTEEAIERLRRDGPNVLAEPPRRSLGRRFADELFHFFAAMLWVAGTLAIIGGLPQLGIAIFVVIVLNAVFAFVQEQRADRAGERLRSLLPQRVTVRRDGRRQQVDSEEIVAGDVLVLEAGDRVPADGLTLTASAAWLDTSMLTGESAASSLAAGDPVTGGTFVVEGEVEALVTATAEDTRLAAVSRLTTGSAKPTTPLTIELRRVVRIVSLIALAVGGAFFLLILALGNPASDGFIVAIGVTVALVPEALLPTVTLSLAWGAEQLSRRQVLVRHLDAVETLGSTTFICTDKTGTLTRNEMTVVEAWTPVGAASVDAPGYLPVAEVALSPSGSDDARDAIRDLARAGARCSTGYVHEIEGVWRVHGDPMEAAIDVFARRVGLDTGSHRGERHREASFPFDPHRRRMSVVSAGEVLVKGAPDSVLPLCKPDPDVGAVLDQLASRGLRVLAVARRPLGGTVPQTFEAAEADLELMGLLALEDPPRDGVADALAACRRAGVKVAMVTGDHPATAAAIADRIRLRDSHDPVISGRDLPSDDAELAALLDAGGAVVARVSPEQKLRIAQVLRAAGNVVAMTGDGVNDAPALHEADIGVAMGRTGTDVAREAADLVLLDDSFESIVAGIEQGRATFVNIRRFLTYHLTDNVAELAPFVLWAVSGGRIPLALGVMQVLALDIGTDTFSAVALGAEPPAAHLLEDPPITGRLMDATVVRRAFGLLGPVATLMSLTAFFATYLASGWRPLEHFPSGELTLKASGAAFLAVVFAQCANAYACRSTVRWPGALGWFSNRLLLPAVGIGLGFSMLIVFVPALADVFEHAPPTLSGWLFVIAAAPALLAVDSLDKVRRRGLRSGEAGDRLDEDGDGRQGEPGHVGPAVVEHVDAALLPQRRDDPGR